MPVSDPDAARALLSRQLHFVSGKGGVGKSVVACALAHRFVGEGQRTLLCQVNAKDTHGALLATGEAPVAIDEEVREAERGLWVVNIDPRAALREYATLVLKFETVVKAILDNRVARAFLRFVPALAELNMLGKVWFHAAETEHGRARFDRIIVDAPSSGHGLSFLRVARVMDDLSRGRGPMAEKTRAMRDVLEDEGRTALHVVTIAEELPTNEALEFIAAARAEPTAPLGLLIANRITPRVLSPYATSLRPSFHDDAQAGLTGDGRALLAAAHRRLLREQQEDEHLARLSPDAVKLPLVQLPLLPNNRFRRAEIASLAEALV